MKLFFNETQMTFLNLELKDVLLLLTIKTHDSPAINTLPSEIIAPFIQKDYVKYSMKAGGYILTELGEQRIHELQTEREEGDTIGKKKEKEINDLVERLRDLFPSGMKVKNVAWRGNRREVALRLKKFMKLYGNKYTSDQIYEATKRYVDSFKGDYTFMRTLPYFIVKSAKNLDSEGKTYIEEKSDLATYLENPEAGNKKALQNDDDWADNMR